MFLISQCFFSKIWFLIYLLSYSLSELNVKRIIWLPIKKEKVATFSFICASNEYIIKKEKGITKYYGIVTGETIIGANLFRDFFASIRDIVGGRSGSYEEVLRQAKDTALREMQDQAALLGANAVVGVDLDYETVGDSGSMLMVTASGTAVRIED